MTFSAGIRSLFPADQRLIVEMSDEPASIDLTFPRSKGEALHRQISRHMRNLIRDGQLAPGLQLPTTVEMAETWETNYFTAHTALTTLVNEGLLGRQRKLGTYVLKRASKLRCVGIYYGDEVLTKQRLAFYRVLHRELLGNLSKKGITQKVFIDSRSIAEQREAHPELQEAINSNSIDGLIVPLINPSDIRWLKNLSLPKAFLSSGNYRLSSVRNDFEVVMDLSLGCLKQNGAKSVGMICPFQQGSIVTNGAISNVHKVFLNAFTQAAKAKGLAISEEWIKYPTEYSEKQDVFGYNAAHEIWKSKSTPDGLFIFPELVASGVVMALLELRLNIPQNLKIVMHRTEQSEWIAPISATCLITSEQATANHLISTVEALFAGREAIPAIESYTLKHKEKWI